ncbi:MAG: CDP-glycerol glycerophosphotransferase family protein [Elusimicrobiales bacterium]|nr:CDP-glycerol glycerophosphotransferase family protein [Elusimicrobiales bacterium]
MNSIKKNLYLLRVFLWPVYFISGFINRDENIIVFGSYMGNRFADNPKYLFLYLNKYFKEKKRYIWITRKKEISKKLKERGFESYSLYSLKGLYYALKAKYYVFDVKSNDICYWTSKGSVKINLWHGIPLKKIEHDMGVDSKYFGKSVFKKCVYKIFGPWIYESPDFVLTTSSTLLNIFSSAFNINFQNIIVSNYPRNIALFKELTGEDIGISNINFDKIKKIKNEGFKIVFYLPTFRDKTGDNFFEIIDFNLINDFCVENKIIFLIKPHPIANINICLSNFENIILLHKYEDIYPYLRLSDILVTDYSSVFFDYYLTEKPIIFFNYDLDEYLSKNRQMYFGYNETCIGWKAPNFSELISSIEDALKNPDKYKLEVEKLISQFFEKYEAPEDFKNILMAVKLIN